MKVSNKLHRVMSIIAAIFLIIHLLSSSVSSVTSIINLAKAGILSSLFLNIVTNLAGLGSVVLFIVVLFRGKKDLLAGILMFLTILFPVITIANWMIQLVSGSIPHFYLAYGLTCLLADFVLLGFRACLGIECVAGGCLSRGPGKFILMALPFMITFLDALASVFSLIGSSMGADIAVILPAILTSVTGVLFNGIPMILLGFAFALPVREQIPAAQ